MLRFLIFTSIIFYLIYKIGSLFFRAGVSSQQPRYQAPRPKQPHDTPHDPKVRKKESIKGGEYVDYEEVK